MYMLCIYVLCTYKRCASLTLSLALSLLFALYYVYVQALRTRVSEAYTELDKPVYKKLERNRLWTIIFLFFFFNISAAT